MKVEAREAFHLPMGTCSAEDMRVGKYGEEASNAFTPKP